VEAQVQAFICMAHKTPAKNTDRSSPKVSFNTIWKALQIDRWFALLDLALLASAILLIFTDGTIFFFHVIFVLLTIGAFFWNFRAFAIRAGIWVAVVIAVLLLKVLAGEIPAEELTEIPLLLIILLLVFAIARQRGRAEALLRDQNQFIKTVFESLGHPFYVIDADDYTIKMANSAAVSGEMSQAVTCYALTHRRATPCEDAGYPCPMKQIKKTGKPVSVEHEHYDLNGDRRVYEIHAHPIFDEEGKIIQIIEYTLDVTERKRMEEALRTAQAETERERERARIARNLHDSLGHSLGYLHLKLDELAGSRALSENLEVRQELAQMRDVTNEAYEVVRGMLAASLPNTSTELATALLVKARSIGHRGDFKVQLASEGQPRPLCPVVQQQLLYLFQEALVNVEKHADAKSVDINLVWGEDTLTVNLSDDGKGFDPERIKSEGHFGLAIMQERAREINGQLTLTSGPDSGTLVVLRLPLDAVSQSPRPV